MDDAHAVGVLGAHGRGTLEHFGIDDPGCQSIGTFNKALGGFGGFLCGDRKKLDRIEQNSRILIGSSPPPLPAAAASAKALDEDPHALAGVGLEVEGPERGFGAVGDLDQLGVAHVTISPVEPCRRVVSRRT